MCTSKKADIDYITNLPSTKVVRPPNRRAIVGQDEINAYLTNLSHLESLICKHPELSLFVEHDVQLNGNMKRLRYRVSLIAVACRYISAYITLESASSGHIPYPQIKGV